MKFLGYTYQQVYRHIRRWFFIIFRPRYVMLQLSARKGHCLEHGCCFSIRCKHFDGKYCKKWHKMPFICQICPIDEEDKTEFMKEHCNFHWERIKQKNVIKK